MTINQNIHPHPFTNVPIVISPFLRRNKPISNAHPISKTINYIT